MTSSHRRTRRRRRVRLPVIAPGTALIAGALLASALIGTRVIAARSTEPLDARTLVAQSLNALAESNLSGAHALAQRATRADPHWGVAHVLAARTALAVGDGVAAEAALARAGDTGFDPAGTRHLFAEARLLQSDPRGALAEASAARPRDAGDALRVKAGALAALGDAAAAEASFAEALAVAPAARTWVDLGRFRLTRGDVGGAFHALEGALARDPGYTPALLLMAQLVRGRNGLLASLPRYEAALARDPANYAVLIDYAATLGDAGRAGAMLSATRRALAARPGDPHALYLLAVLAARAERHDLARALLQRTGTALAGRPGPLLLGATLDLQAGGDEQAVEKLRNLLGLQPMNLQARRLLGLALLRSDAPGEALDVLRPMALRSDADSYTLTLAARAFERIGDRANASALLGRAAVPKVVDPPPFSSDGSVAALAASLGAAAPTPGDAALLIRAELDARSGEKALARAAVAAAANPGSPAAITLLGDTLTALGRHAAAIAPYRRAAALRFDEPAMLRLVAALDAAGRRDEAEDRLAAFLAQNPRNIAALRLTAHRQIASGAFHDAVGTLERLRARLGGRDAALLAGLAMAYDGARQPDLAQSFAAAAYRLAPLNPAVIDAYGWTMFGAGDPEGALQLLQKAVAIAPREGSLRSHLAQINAALGQSHEAREYAHAAQIHPPSAARPDAEALARSAFDTARRRR
jgi:tetratricopeptide (TPR) repeat protein